MDAHFPRQPQAPFPPQGPTGTASAKSTEVMSASSFTPPAAVTPFQEGQRAQQPAEAQRAQHWPQLAQQQHQGAYAQHGQRQPPQSPPHPSQPQPQGYTPQPQASQGYLARPQPQDYPSPPQTSSTQPYALTQPSAPPAAGAETARPAKPRGRAPLFIGIGAGTLAVGGLIAAGIAIFGGKSALPCAVENLPKEMTRLETKHLDVVLAHKLGVEKSDVPEQATWSLLANKVCDGADLFDSAMAGAGESLARAFASRDSARAALECGKALSDGLGQYAVVRFGDGDDKHRVGVLRSSLEAYPTDAKGVKKASNRGKLVQVRCFVPDPDEECEDKSKGVGHIEDSKLWIHGSIADMEAFAKAYSPDGKTPPKGSEAYASLLSNFGGYDEVKLGPMRELEADDFSGSTGAGGAEERKPIEEKRSSLGGHWARGVKGDDYERVERVVLVFDKESGAKEMEGLLKAFKKDTLVAMAKQKEALDKGSPTGWSTPEQREFYEMALGVMEMRRSAYKDATIERDGTSVVFQFEMKADDALREILDGREKAQTKKLAAAAKVVDALLGGDPAPKDALEELGDGKFVTAATTPPSKREAAPGASPPPAATALGVLVPGAAGFRVPAGATSREIPLDGGRVGHEYVFPGSGATAIEEYFKTTIANGWDCSPDAAAKYPLMICKKGGATVRMLFGNDESSRFYVSVLP